MMISIIIPIYNAQMTIQRALDSVVQAGNIDEIICIDDGSTDKSVQQINNWAEIHSDINVKIIHQKNQGAAAARNKGMQEAKGTYILFLDSDDTLPAGSGKKYMKFVRQYPDCDIYMGTMVHQIQGRNQPIRTQKIPSGLTTLKDTPELLQSIGPGAKLYRASSIHQPFDTTIQFCEEHTFNVDLLKGKVLVFDDIVYEYHLDTENSITKDVSQFNKYMNNAMSVRKKVWSMLPETVKAYYSYRMDGLIVSYFIKRVLESGEKVNLQPVFDYLNLMLESIYEEQSFYQIIDFVLLYGDSKNKKSMMNWCDRHHIDKRQLKFIPGTVKGRVNRLIVSSKSLVKSVIQ